MYTPGPSPPATSTKGGVSSTTPSEKISTSRNPSGSSSSAIHAGQAALAARIEQERADARLAAQYAAEAEAAEAEERRVREEKDRRADEEFAAYLRAEKEREEAEERRRVEEDEAMARMMEEEAAEEERRQVERREREQADEEMARSLAEE